MKLEATVIVTRYKEPNSLLFDTIKSLFTQKGTSLEILILDQFYDNETEQFCKKLNSSGDHTFLYTLIDPISLSYARNYGLKSAKNNIVIFIDSDAIAMDNWSYEIINLLKENNQTRIVGTKILPKWNGKKNILTKSNYFSSVYSLLDLGDGVLNISKVIGASFAVNKNNIEDIFFNENLGRKNGVLLGGEETEFCDKVKLKGFNIQYTGKTYVLHQINQDRLQLTGLIERVVFLGVGRAMKGGLPSPHKTKKNIFDYLFFPLFLMFYGYGYIYGTLKYKK
ncbi:glycosyltransferase family 2 protein [Candidatus Gracilibacteria bacterium]|nr:glycosyltransferase family 2 protein [Candidatus Gracilibacteria bacterium]